MPAARARSDVGAHPEPDHHQVGRDRTRRGLDGRDASIGRGEAGDRGAESQVDPAARIASATPRGHVGVQHRTHRRVEPFDHRHVETAFKQSLRNLQSDVAGADHHGAPGPGVESSFHRPPRRRESGAAARRPRRCPATEGRCPMRRCR